MMTDCLDPRLSQLHQDITEACQNGNLVQLQRLFRQNNFKKGDLAIKRDYRKQEPRSIQWEDDSHKGILVHACRLARSDDSIIVWLVQHGADPTIDSLRMGGAVSAAMREGRSVMVVEKFLGSDKWLGNCSISIAVNEGRLDVLEMFRRKGMFDQKSGENLKRALRGATKEKKEELAPFVDAVIAEVEEKQEVDEARKAVVKGGRVSSGSEQSFEGKGERLVQKSWWQVWK